MKGLTLQAGRMQSACTLLKSGELDNGYTERVLRGKLARRNGEDSRDFATYTIPEAALILGIPPRTVQQWFAGDIPVLKPSAYIGDFPLLSFRDALDVYALFLLRSRHRLSMQEIKKAIKI